MKPSLDLNSMKEFSIQHAEKFVFGGVILLLLLLAVQAVGTIRNAGPEFTPAELSAEAKSAKEHIQNTPVSAYLEKPELRAPPYSKIAPLIGRPVPETPYTHDVVWRKPIFEQLGKREQPGLIPLKDLRATAGHGAVQWGSEPAAGAITRGSRGQRWVVVTGLIPIKSQMEAYQTAFQDAEFKDPQRDVPMYLGYRLKKVELSGSGGTANVDWDTIQPIKVLEAFRVQRYFRVASREVVHQMYLPVQAPGARMPMVFPLPPLTRAAWGPEVAHYPEIPLLIDMPESLRGSLGAYAREDADAEAGTEEGVEQDQVDEFAPGPAGLTGPGGRRTGPMVGGRYGPGMSTVPGGQRGYPGMGEFESGMEEYGDMDSTPGYGYGYGYGASSYGAGRYGAGRYGSAVPGRPGLASQAPEPVEYQLFRFFDFHVQPGKRYQYRVQLVLLNPNYEKFVPERYLASKDLGAKYYIETAWSGPSDVVAVPYDSRLVAGPVKPAPNILYEPSTRVVAVTLRMEDGLEAAQDFTVYRGHLANFEGKIVRETGRGGAFGMPYGYEGLGEEGDEMDDYLGDYMGGDYTPPGRAGEPKRPARKPKAGEEEGEKITHATNMLVLDMVGGDRLHRTDRSLTEPGSLLLLDPDGNLIVRKELDDLDEYLVYHVEEEKPTRRRKPDRRKERYPGMADEYGDMMGDMMGEEEEGGRRRAARGRRGRGYDE